MIMIIQSLRHQIILKKNKFYLHEIFYNNKNKIKTFSHSQKINNIYSNDKIWMINLLFLYIYKINNNNYYILLCYIYYNIK